jgi:WXXGXW repeat (2 copies)
MKRMTLRVAGLMVLFGALSVATAHADTRFSIHVGVGAPVAPPVVVAPRPYAYAAPVPYPGYVWQPGYYVGYRWVPGAWVPRGHWNHRNGRHDHRYDDRRHDDRGWNGDRRYR